MQILLSIKFKNNCRISLNSKRLWSQRINIWAKMKKKMQNVRYLWAKIFLILARKTKIRLHWFWFREQGPWEQEYGRDQFASTRIWSSEPCFLRSTGLTRMGTQCSWWIQMRITKMIKRFLRMVTCKRMLVLYGNTTSSPPAFQRSFSSPTQLEAVASLQFKKYSKRLFTLK
jgi:hypothetical protein